MKNLKKPLILIGAGEMAEIAFEYFTYDSEYSIQSFFVEKDFITKTTLCGLPVYPYEELATHCPPNKAKVFTAIPSTQMNNLRKRFYLDLKSKGYDFATYISSRAFVWKNAKIGENSFVFENNVIQPFVQIGNNCILWSGNHVGHRTVIGDHCFLTSHVVVSGYCVIEDGCFLGVNSTLNDKVRIPSSCVVGSGSLVTKSLNESNSIYVGSPVKKILGKNPLDLQL